MLYFILAYLVVGYLLAILFYAKLGSDQGGKVKDIGAKAAIVMFFWIIISLVVIFMLPFNLIDEKRKRNRGADNG
jgi:hypothetical protein